MWGCVSRKLGHAAACSSSSGGRRFPFAPAGFSHPGGGERVVSSRLPRSTAAPSAAAAALVGVAADRAAAAALTRVRGGARSRSGFLRHVA